MIFSTEYRQPECDESLAEDAEVATRVHYYQDEMGILHNFVSPALDQSKDAADSVSSEAQTLIMQANGGSKVSLALAACSLLTSTTLVAQAALGLGLNAFDFALSGIMLSATAVAAFRARKKYLCAEYMSLEAENYHKYYAALVEQEYQRTQAQDSRLMFR